MKKIHPIVWAILCLPVVYFAMVAASVYIPGENIFALLERISTMVRRPDLLRWTAYTPRFLLVFLLLYGGGVLLYYADHENRRPGEEYGSAKWGNARELNKRYADQNGKNVILTKRVSIGLDGYKHRRNLNILVVGGSGSGKTRFFCKPGIMSVNCSYLIVDPKGEMLRSTGYLLKDEGYDIILGWGIVQVGMSIQSHDASQRTQGLLCLFGGLLITFAKEILTLIGAV